MNDSVNKVSESVNKVSESVNKVSERFINNKPLINNMKEYAVYDVEGYGQESVFIPIDEKNIFEKFLKSSSMISDYTFWDIFYFDERFIDGLGSFDIYKSDYKIYEKSWKKLGYVE